VERIPAAQGIAISQDQRHFFVTNRNDGDLDAALSNATVKFRPGDGQVLAYDTDTAQRVELPVPEKPGTLWLSHALAVAV
jgi:hypothetical protein